MLEPYTNRPEASLEYQLSDTKAAAELGKHYQGQGYPIHIHAGGDGAVRRGIDQYAAAIDENGQTGARLSIEHMDLTSPEDWARLGEYDIISSVQPPHITLSPSLAEDEYIPTVGEERARSLWALKSLQENGSVLAFGTDFPVVTPDPRIGIHRAVTRRFPDGLPEQGWNP